ncbi:MAG: hypothetical protein ABS70_04750 [Nitrospira sp. SCN 59-13]|nr:MAG: hypothetical protein ABS70_04750 [Nitrospira sp. SCN 59-13]
MRNNDWGLRAFVVGVTMVLGLAPLFAEVSLDSKAPAPSSPSPGDDYRSPAPERGTGALAAEPEGAPELEDRLVILPEIKRDSS